MVEILANVTNDGRRLWVGTNTARVSGLAGSVTKKLLRSGKGTGLGHVKTVSGLISVLEKKMRYIVPKFVILLLCFFVFQPASTQPSDCVPDMSVGSCYYWIWEYEYINYWENGNKKKEYGNKDNKNHMYVINTIVPNRLVHTGSSHSSLGRSKNFGTLGTRSVAP